MGWGWGEGGGGGGLTENDQLVSLKDLAQQQSGQGVRERGVGGGVREG